MSNEQERLAASINEAAETLSSCGGCYLGLLLLLALPMIVVAVWGIVGSGTGSDWLGVAAAGVAAVWLLVTAARLTGWGR